jgi:hypothetical protein
MLSTFSYPQIKETLEDNMDKHKTALNDPRTEFDLALNLARLIQKIRHNNETKVRVVNRLVREEARIQIRHTELVSG